MAKVSNFPIDPLSQLETLVTESKPTTTFQTELDAISAAYALLGPLTFEQKRRVIAWLMDKFGIKT